MKKIITIIMFCIVFIMLICPISFIYGANFDIAYNFIKRGNENYEAIEASFDCDFLNDTSILKISYNDSFFSHSEQQYRREGNFSFKKYLSQNSNYNFGFYFNNKNQKENYIYNSYSMGIGSGYDLPILSFFAGMSYKNRHLYVPGLQYKGFIEQNEIHFPFLNEYDITPHYVNEYEMRKMLNYLQKYSVIIIDKYIPGYEHYDKTYWFDLNGELNWNILRAYGKLSINVKENKDYDFEYGGELRIPKGNFSITPGAKVKYDSLTDRDKIVYTKLGFNF